MDLGLSSQPTHFVVVVVVIVKPRPSANLLPPSHLCLQVSPPASPLLCYPPGPWVCSSAHSILRKKGPTLFITRSDCKKYTVLMAATVNLLRKASQGKIA